MSLLLSTCSIINSSLNVITGFKQLNSKFSSILKPNKGLKISDNDRRRLVSLHRRVECLIEPLNFCIIWIKDRNSCILPIIQYSSDLVQSVSEFLDKVKFTADDMDPFTRVLEPESSLKVDYFLRELDFACTSVSMAVSVAKSSQVDICAVGSQISPAALLRASTRICEMLNRSGDLCAISGTLFKRSEAKWHELSSGSILKIAQYKALDPLDAPYLIRVSYGSSDSGLTFPIQTGLSMFVTTVKSLDLPVISPLDSVALSWKYTTSPEDSMRRLLHRNPSGALDTTDLSMDSSDEDTFVVRGAAEIPRTLRARISSTHISGPDSEAEYSFLFNFSSSSLSPLDVVYIARLCVIESLRRNSANDSTTLSSPRSIIQSPLHLEESDEALIALLADARSDCNLFNSPSEIDLVVSEEHSS
jgi:hypothetical protein